jgi:hypothetical protein
VSEIEETAKAVQEASKFGSDLVKSIKHLEKIGRQLLGPFGEGYGILSDIVRYKREELSWRFQNRKAIYKLALKRAQDRCLGIDDLRTVPKRIAYDYEDGLEREDDEILQELWANLLINVTDPQKGLLPSKIYKEILCKIDREQALFLNEIRMRHDAIMYYFIVCDIVDGSNNTIGAQLAFGLRDMNSTQVLSTKLFELTEDHAFEVPWSSEKIESMVDILQSMGLIHWTRELHMAGGNV